MVTVYAKTKSKAQRMALLLSVLVSFNAAADGLFLPETLLNPNKAKPVEVKPAAPVAAKPLAAAVQVQPAPAPIASAPVVAKPVVTAPVVAAAPVAKPPAPITQGISVPAPTLRPVANIPAPPPAADEPDAILPENLEGIEADDDDDGATTTANPTTAKCDGSAKCMSIRAAGLNASGKNIAKAVTKKRFSPETLAQNAFYQAARCRDFADFKERRMGIAKYRTARTKKGLRKVQISVTYNSCKFFGKDNVRRSKGLCARAVQEAFSASGIKIAKGHARDLRPNLKRAGFSQIKYNPYKAASGTVLVCNGGASGYGHAEIVVISNGERQFCSDFCSPSPTCSSRKGYSNFTAFSL